MFKSKRSCRNPTLRQVWGWDSHSRKWELGVLQDSRNFRAQNTLYGGVLYIVEKVSECRCRKWPRMGHSDTCSISYGQKKGRESNWQFDSRPQKVGNRPDPTLGCAEGVQHTIGKLLKRATSSLETSFQFEVWARSCDLPKFRESKPG
jgi:hypothetical protein